MAFAAHKLSRGRCLPWPQQAGVRCAGLARDGGGHGHGSGARRHGTERERGEREDNDINSGLQYWGRCNSPSIGGEMQRFWWPQKMGDSWRRKK